MVILETSSQNYIRFLLNNILVKDALIINFDKTGFQVKLRGSVFNSDLNKLKNLGFELLYFTSYVYGHVILHMTYTDELEDHMDKNFDKEGIEIKEKEK